MNLRKRERKQLSVKNKLSYNVFDDDESDEAKFVKEVRERNTYKECSVYFDYTIKDSKNEDLPNLYKKYVNILEIKDCRNNRVWNSPIVELDENDKYRARTFYTAFLLWLCQKKVFEMAKQNVPCTYFFTQKDIYCGRVRIIPYRHIDISSLDDWERWFDKNYFYRQGFNLDFQVYHKGSGGPKGCQKYLLNYKELMNAKKRKFPLRKNEHFLNFIKKVQKSNIINTWMKN